MLQYIIHRNIEIALPIIMKGIFMRAQFQLDFARSFSSPVSIQNALKGTGISYVDISGARGSPEARTANIARFQSRDEDISFLFSTKKVRRNNAYLCVRSGECTNHRAHRLAAETDCCLQGLQALGLQLWLS